MADRQINESSTLFALTGFVLLAQSRQSGRGQRRMTTIALFLDDTDHRFFVVGLELVVGIDKVRWNFAAQRLRQMRELDLRVRCPAMSQKSFGFIQRKQFGGRPVHGLFFLLGQRAPFPFGQLRHLFQRCRQIRFEIRFPIETSHLGEPA